MPRTRKSDGRPIDSYAHAGKERLNNPPIGLVTPDTDPDAGNKTHVDTGKSHINVFGYDSGWKVADAFQLDERPYVAAWAKNDHLGFEVLYIDRGVVRKYRPDFLVRLATGDMLILETKGQDTEQDRVKRRYLDEWVQAINQHGGFGRLHWGVAKQPGDVLDILARHGPGE